MSYVRSTRDHVIIREEARSSRARASGIQPNCDSGSRDLGEKKIYASMSTFEERPHFANDENINPQMGGIGGSHGTVEAAS